MGTITSKALRNLPARPKPKSILTVGTLESETTLDNLIMLLHTFSLLL